MEVPTEVITCCGVDCGISFAVPLWWIQGKRCNHSYFYCPNGHHQHFTGESELEKVRRERDLARQQIERAEQEASEALEKAFKAERATRRLKKRAAGGTCPCCQRTFSNMAQHMQKQHADFIAEEINVVPLRAKK